jgi:hypothetical protein
MNGDTHDPIAGIQEQLHQQDVRLSGVEAKL